MPHCMRFHRSLCQRAHSIKPGAPKGVFSHTTPCEYRLRILDYPDARTDDDDNGFDDDISMSSQEHVLPLDQESEHESTDLDESPAINDNLFIVSMGLAMGPRLTTSFL